MLIISGQRSYGIVSLTDENLTVPNSTARGRALRITAQCTEKYYGRTTKIRAPLSGVLYGQLITERAPAEIDNSDIALPTALRKTEHRLCSKAQLCLYRYTFDATYRGADLRFRSLVALKSIVDPATET